MEFCDKGLRVLRAKNAPSKLVYIFILCSLTHADYKIKNLNMSWKSSLKIMRVRKSAPTMHFNVTDFHCLDRKNSQK